ncbi:hypothetical protein F4803DRAFT_506338 [Xylaria telfairii]|nr:hypothetical protein F4803DRAFT_506338 [Xylaria telfairii]
MRVLVFAGYLRSTLLGGLSKLGTMTNYHGTRPNEITAHIVWTRRPWYARGLYNFASIDKISSSKNDNNYSMLGLVAIRIVTSI